jgi:hypothetical protein
MQKDDLNGWLRDLTAESPANQSESSRDSRIENILFPHLHRLIFNCDSAPVGESLRVDDETVAC